MDSLRSRRFAANASRRIVVTHLGKFCLIFAAALLTMAAGCGKSAVDPSVVKHREQLILKEEPSGALGILDARETIASPAEVTLVGRIGGTDSPWTLGQASFVMADPSVASDSHEHCGDDCPFCKHKSDGQDALALVQFHDQHGNVLPVDARELFELQDQDTVVVQGRAQINELGLMVVAAKGIYVRR
jgi:hypothetical protein